MGARERVRGWLSAAESFLGGGAPSVDPAPLIPPDHHVQSLGSRPTHAHVGDSPGDQAAMLEHAGIHSATSPMPGGKSTVLTAHHQGTIDPFTAGFDQGNDTPIVRLMKKFPGYVRLEIPHGLTHQLWMITMHVMRKSIPALDSAILKRRFLEGNVVARSDDEGLAKDINTFMQEVEVGFTPEQPITGLQNWVDQAGELADEFGESFPEIRLSENGREIERLVVADSRLFEFKKDSPDEEDWFLFAQRRKGLSSQRVDSPLVRTFHFTPSPVSPWGRPLASGLEFTGEVFIRLMISMNNLIWRMGDPSKIWKLLYDPNVEVGEGDDVEDLQLLKDTVAAAYRARNRGETIDVFYSTQGAKLESEALGENLLVSSLAPQFKGYLAMMTATIVGKSDVPAWLFPAGIIPAEGLNSDRAQMEGVVAQVAASQRAALLDRIARWAINQWLILEKSSRFIGKYTLERDMISPISQKLRQEAREKQALADASFTDNASILEVLGVLKNTDLPQFLREREVIN